MENQALDIIDMLYVMIAEARSMPLSGDKCMIDRDKALGLMDDLKAVLPYELVEARRLMNARDEFVSRAKQEADELRRTAEEKAASLVERQNVYLEAQKRGEEIVQEAEKKARDLRRVASDYLDDALRQTEDAVADALNDIRTARSRFKAISAPEPEGTAEVTLQDVEDEDLMVQ